MIKRSLFYLLLFGVLTTSVNELSAIHYTRTIIRRHHMPRYSTTLQPFSPEAARALFYTAAAIVGGILLYKIGQAVYNYCNDCPEKETTDHETTYVAPLHPVYIKPVKPYYYTPPLDTYSTEIVDVYEEEPYTKPCTTNVTIHEHHHCPTDCPPCVHQQNNVSCPNTPQTTVTIETPAANSVSTTVEVSNSSSSSEMPEWMWGMS